MKPLHAVGRLLGYLVGYAAPLTGLGIIVVLIYQSNMVQHVVHPKHYWEKQARERQQDFFNQRQLLIACLNDAGQARGRAVSDLQELKSAGVSAAEATTLVNELNVDAAQGCKQFSHDLRDSYLKYLEAVNNFNNLPN